ncbi:MAG: hypothetical protein ITG02_11975 [Patulibacter sp.]|nr:hypothetical protein [Patulibacter sp.]
MSAPNPKIPSDLPSDRDVDAAIPQDEPAAGAVHVTARLVIPLALIVVGIVLLIVGLTTFGIVVAFAGMIAFIADRLIRFGIVSQGDRDREAAARDRMRRKGRWTDR